MSNLNLNSQIENQYLGLLPKYEKLGANLKDAIEILLQEQSINYLTVDYRIKDYESFEKKIERKKYSNPFEQTEDICGIRVICYYQDDIEKICNIVRNEFDILQSEDKEELLKPDQFGYRSYHFIIKIKNQWLCTPNYKDLKGLKAEIQIRTNLMHTWAEIEHKLEYKKEEDIPAQFKRKFYIISAKLEEADEQFQELRNNILEYRKKMLEEAERNDTFFANEDEINLDNLQVFLDLFFHERKKDLEQTSFLLAELKDFDISILKLKNLYEETYRLLPEIEREELELFAEYKEILGSYKWSQVGAVRVILQLTVNEYLEYINPPSYSYKIIKKFKKELE